MSSENPSLRALHVLLVEDDDLDLELILDALRQTGFEPDWRRVEDEREFVAALASRFEIVLADLNLPSFGAIRALEVLAELSAGIPLIVVSGSLAGETVREAKRLGASGCVNKDRLSELGRTVARVLDLRGSEDDPAVGRPGTSLPE